MEPIDRHAISVNSWREWFAGRAEILGTWLPLVEIDTDTLIAGVHRLKSARDDAVLSKLPDRTIDRIDGWRTTVEAELMRRRDGSAGS